MADYIPRADSAALNWFNAFKSGTSSNPGLYQLSGPDAATIASVVDVFAWAYMVVNDPARRNVATISTKAAPRQR